MRDTSRQIADDVGKRWTLNGIGIPAFLHDVG
jgi:hypothetical protein